MIDVSASIKNGFVVYQIALIQVGNVDEGIRIVNFNRYI